MIFNFLVAIYVKTSADKITHPLNVLMVTIAVIMTLSGFAGATVSFLESINYMS